MSAGRDRACSWPTTWDASPAPDGAAPGHILNIGQRSGFVASTNFADKPVTVAWVSASGTASMSRRPDVEQLHWLVRHTRAR